MPRLDAARPPVALFRALKDAERSAARLRRLGFKVARLPVIAIAAIDASPRRRRYDAVIATSEKAFLADIPADRIAPLFAVGALAGRAGESRGWRLGAPPAADAAELVAQVKRALPPGAALLYLAGRDRKPAIETALEASNELEVVEVYAAEARAHWRPAEVRSLLTCAIALHYSRRSASLATELAERAGVGARFRRMIHVCLSDDVAGPVRAIGARDVWVAGAPQEEALIAALIASTAIFPSQRPSPI
ncbi:MAG TPA: uroporphyrinogen-III synthase [Roseiarcus sp.]|nr:uroporphyrinogen-III synthase [Roseiarcus sp.]